MVLVYYFGYMGPLTLMLWIIYFSQYLGKNWALKILFINLSNLLINWLLKNLIRQKRPDNQINLTILDQMDSKEYGMPSSHAQQVTSSLLILLQLKTRFSGKIRSPLNLFFIIQACATCIHRFIYKKHTKEQIIVGIIIGYLHGCSVSPSLVI